MNEHELNSEWSPLQLYLIWSMKESLYKLQEGNVEKYREDIEVLEISDEKINGCVNGQYPETFYQLIDDNIILVYSLLEL